MAKKVRSGVFETNSSSMHSIVINREKDMSETLFSNLKMYEGSKILIDIDEEFGWSGPRTNDPDVKCKYALISVMDKNDKETYKEIIELIKKYTGAKEVYVYYNRYDDGGLYNEDMEIMLNDVPGFNLDCLYGDGYIDHQSQDTFADFINESNHTVEEFIMDRKVELIIDSDG